MGINRRFGMLSKAEIRKIANRPQSRTRRARLGFIGAGWWATTNHMPLLAARRDVEMVSVCGLDPKILERCRRDFGFQHVTSDYHDLLRQELDGVIVASPHAFHAEHALASLRAGCHVLVEKPFATNARDARAVVALARQKRRHIIVPYGWNYRPLGLKTKAFMKRHSVGRIEYVMLHMASQLKNLLSGRAFDFTNGAYVNSNLSTWANPSISGGGYAQAQLPHATGLMFWLTGLRAESVFATMSRPGSKVDLYDALSVRYRGGAIGVVSGAATLPPGSPWAFQVDIRIFGSKGLIHIDLPGDHVSFHSHDGRHITAPIQPDDGIYLCDEPPHRFIELILGLSTENNSSGEVATRSVELLDAAYRSAKSGRVEKV